MGHTYNTSTYVYDLDGRLVRIDVTGNGGPTVIAERRFTYDADGRLVDDCRDGNQLGAAGAPS